MVRPFALVLPLIASTASALDFYFQQLIAFDLYEPSSFHIIEFEVCAPDNGPYQGGSGTATCRITWDDTASTCWSLCESESERYFTRVTPGSYVNAEEFSVDIWQSYINEIGVHNNATVAALSGYNGFYCDLAAQSLTCQMSVNSFCIAEESTFFDGADPADPGQC